MEICWVVDLDRVTYRRSLELQQKLCFKRAYGDIPDIMVFLEHPHVYTTGRRTEPAHLGIDRDGALAIGADIIAADRGGSVTYHGPGQIVVYPVLNLGYMPDLHRYLRDLEQVIILALSEFDIAAETIAGLTGVWVNGAKIASIGVKVSQGITKHGFSLNIDPQLDFFEKIDACGTGKPATSVRKVLGTAPAVAKVKDALIRSFGTVFERDMKLKDETAVNAVRSDIYESKIS